MKLKNPQQPNFFNSIYRTIANIAKSIKLFTGCINPNLCSSACKCDKYITEEMLLNKKTKSFIQFMYNLLSNGHQKVPTYQDWEYIEGRDPVRLMSLNGLGKHVKVKRNSEWSQENNIEIHAISLDPNLKNLCTGYNEVTNGHSETVIEGNLDTDTYESS
jgi:hypothetical protein